MRRTDLPAPPPPPSGTRYPIEPRYQLAHGADGAPLLVERSPELDESDYQMLVDEHHGPWIGLRSAHLLPFHGLVYWHKQAFRYYDYAPSWTLDSLVEACERRGEAVPVAVASAVVAGVLRGAHELHEARGPGGEALGLVHRNIGPCSVLVGHDGVARLFDYAPMRRWERGGSRGPQATIRVRDLNMMAPEQILADPIDGRLDVYASAALLWWMLTGRLPFRAFREIDVVQAILANRVQPPSSLRPSLDAELDRVALRGLSLRPDERFATAQAMAEALEAAAPPATPGEVAAWGRSVGAAGLVPGPAPDEVAEGDDAEGVHPYRGGGHGRDEPKRAPRVELTAEVPTTGLLLALGVGLIAACTLIKSCGPGPRPRAPSGAAVRIQP